MRVVDLPVMLRAARTALAVSDKAGQVERVSDPDELAIAERTIVEGFPVSALRPWRRGEALPAHVLAIPGWSVLLSRSQTSLLLKTARTTGTLRVAGSRS